ncbi:MAG TPA: hypothetical protein GXZ23_03510 [Clostridiales bacterium]|nr:hypothetical protein [Clostridiales bacterium]
MPRTTEKKLRKLSRRDLLQMLIEQSQEVELLKKKLAEAEAALENKTIAIDEAGSIAECSFKLSGIFQATQDACQMYMDNVRQLCQRQEEESVLREKETIEKAKRIVEEAEKHRTFVELNTKVKCDQMLDEAKEQAQRYLDEASRNLNKFYGEHATLNDFLATIPPQKS